jgi:hypothetical protein
MAEKIFLLMGGLKAIASAARKIIKPNFLKILSDLGKPVSYLKKARLRLTT